MIDKEQKQRSNVLEPVVGLALYGLFGPVFNAAVVGVLYKLGYELDLLGMVLWLFFSALYLLAGVLLLVFFAFYQRKPHTPLAMKSISAWVLLTIVASSAGINVWWVNAGIFCDGACPTYQYRADGAAKPPAAPRAAPDSAPENT